MLKSIELIGFKSFARKSNLFFNQRITAIVGPNGSGKSNTAEAFRFVFGEQSSKVMRVKRSSDVIWNGSHIHTRGSMANVRVILDNSSRKFNIDFNDVIIERKVTRDGINEYLVNGSVVRAKDVQELLSVVNVGNSGHNIISQGQADKILTASKKERREIIEEALGLKIFNTKKMNALKKIKETHNNLEKAESKKREITPQLNYLNRQVQKSKEIIDDKKRLAYITDHFYYNKINVLNVEYNKIYSSLSNNKKTLADIKEKMENISNRIDSIRENDSSYNDEISYKSKQIMKLRSEYAILKTDLGRIDGKLDVFDDMPELSDSAVDFKIIEKFLMDIIAYIEAAEYKLAVNSINIFLKQHNVKKDEKLNNIEDDRKKITEERKKIIVKIDEIDRLIKEREVELNDLRDESINKKQKDTEDERDLYRWTAEFNKINALIIKDEDYLNTIIDQKKSTEDLYNSVKSITEGVDYDGYESSGLNSDKLDGEIRRLFYKVEQYGEIDNSIFDEYSETKKYYDFLSNEINDLQNSIHKINDLINNLDRYITDKFTIGVDNINKELQNFFNVLFGGGNAKMVIVTMDNDDENNLSNKGIDINVSVPRKKVTTLETLSGGERALTSIAIIFAMSQINPPPFIILDETDAALDEANSRRYVDMIKKLSEKSQIILITHNRATMSVADVIYGVTMNNDGISQLLSVQLSDAEKYAK